jgi:hypothetical protein
MGQLLGVAMSTTQASSVRADLAAVSVRESLATRTILSGLVSGIGHNAAGVVVVGDGDSADDGELAALRESQLTGPISTVDGMETTIGQVTIVLAMQAVISGTTGSYGASGSDGVVPLP